VKITTVKATAVALPLRRPHPMAFGGAGLGRYVIVEISTDEGITGLGEATVLLQWGGDNGRYYGESAQTTTYLVREVFAPALSGLDPFSIEQVHRLMDQLVKGYPYAKCAIDLALHDIKGKACAVPTYELLGGLFRRAIPIAHSLGILDLPTMIDEATTAVEEGVRTIKIKIGLDPDRDITAVREVRREVGDEIDIVVDANQGYASPKLAIQTLRAMEEYRIRYAEQPVEGIAGLARVAAALDISIGADESAWGPTDVLEIANRRAADIISLYTTKPGGLLPAKKVAAVAEAAGLACNVNGSAETGVGNAANLHLAASTPAVSEVCVIPVTTLLGREQTKIAGRYYTDDIVKDPFIFRNGCLEVPDRHGLGIELDVKKVEKYRIA
jgi:muconate cycloisomerase